ncbi:MAG: TolC family protein [Saprospiraceae bacterium]|nr:TolC family protein [Saprospiraceae bacterium]
MQNIHKILIAFVAIAICSATLQAQDTMRVTLQEVVRMAQGQAPDVQLAKTRLSNRYWSYQSFLADYKPKIGLNATLPNLNRSIDAITLPDGREAFIQRGFMSTSVGISLQQDVALTGGTVFVNTSLRRLDIFASGGNPSSLSYLSTPIGIGFIQPIFGFNALKWNKKVEPLRYQEATRGYSEDMEAAAYDAVNLFFEVLIAQLNTEAAKQEKSNADTLYRISQGRYEVGKIAETELLQIELSVANAESALAEATLNLQSSTERLRNFLGITRSVQFEMVPPADIPTLAIDADKALGAALQNRSQIIALDRRLREAELEVARSKGNTGPQVNLVGNFGLSQTGTVIGDAYKDPLNQEALTLGLEVPIADWGKAKASRQIAQSNLELERMNVAQERVNFEREVLLKVQQFDLVRNQVERALRSWEISKKRQEMSRNRYYIGKLGITELNIAVAEQDAARRSYVSALRSFWVAFYDIRRSTLYDFENDRPLVQLPDGY